MFHGKPRVTTAERTTGTHRPLSAMETPRPATASFHGKPPGTVRGTCRPRRAWLQELADLRAMFHGKRTRTEPCRATSGLACPPTPRRADPRLSRATPVNRRKTTVTALERHLRLPRW